MTNKISQIAWLPLLLLLVSLMRAMPDGLPTRLAVSLASKEASQLSIAPKITVVIPAQAGIQ